ncbi:MAG: PEP-CTERM/exosortase system-associated acyltransferase [Methylococcales bacterium]|jgi:N-acyl amino acid synthase of PEP-CTERM/exosortase system|nr:PEP-CTERM/exosortase system-associated acyltransferase [Methylococcales bacterium]MBT7443175.1 PEP-CTERM/exosortase system-associated acyltransferase [Methylococcales bacterium]
MFSSTNTKVAVDHPQQESSDLAELFQQYFEVVPATTDSLKRVVYSIRYKVYCEDLSYESQKCFPDGLESDEHDCYADHYLLKHKSSQEYVGCMRYLKKQKNRLLPFEKLAALPSNSHEADYAELSRLAILPEYRRRMGDSQYGIDTNASIAEERRLFPHISLGLILVGPALMLSGQCSVSYAVMEPRFCRLLKRFGLHIDRVSDVFNYRGKRAVYRLSLSQIKSGPTPLVTNMLAYIQSQVTVQPSLHLVCTENAPRVQKVPRLQQSKPVCLHSVPSNG